MPPPLSWAVQAFVAATFAWAATSKLSHWSAWRASLGSYGIPRRLRTATEFSVPLVEVAVAVVVVTGPTKVALAVALALVSVFSLAILRARARTGDRLPCGCFGGTEERDYRLMLLRNSVLAGLTGILLLFGEDGDLVSRPGAPEIDDAVPGLLVLVGALLILWLAKHAASLLHRRENT